MKYPRFSVITVSFNNREGLQRTMQSVLSQDFTDFEYVVVDGGSTDGSVDVIKNYSEKLAYWVSEPDGGVYYAMNKAVAQARGTHCIFMNSGDELYSSTVLSEVAEYGFDYDLAVGVSSNVMDGKETCRVYPPQRMSLLFWENYSVIHQAVFMRTSLLKKFPYDTCYRIVADWKHMLTLYLNQNYRYRALPIVICKFEGGGLSDNTEKRNTERDKALNELLSPMLYQDAMQMRELRLLAVDDDTRNNLSHILESRTLTRLLKSIMKILCVIH